MIVAMCTSNITRNKETTQYLIKEDELEITGIKIPSVVKCESLFTINKSMVVKILGILSAAGKENINICLKDALDLK